MKRTGIRGATLDIDGYKKLNGYAAGEPSADGKNPSPQSKFDCWLADEGLLDQLVFQIDFGEGGGVVHRFTRDEDGRAHLNEDKTDAIVESEFVMFKNPSPVLPREVLR